MDNILRMFLKKKITPMALASTFVLFCFNGSANATLSGLEPGYPRFISTDTLSYRKSGQSGTVTFNSDSTLWQQHIYTTPEVVSSASFDVNVNLDVSNSSNPSVLAGSSISIFGEIASLGTGSVSLFTADIYDIGWQSGSNAIIEFIMDGSTMAGAVCDLGFCSYVDEVLQFTLDRKFSVKWHKKFDKSALAIATVPVPAAIWLFGSAILGLGGLRRKIIA